MTTQNCAECGTRAEPGQSFCDACGAVLTWDRPARAARSAGPSPHDGAPAADPRTASGAEPAAPPRTGGGTDTRAGVGTAAGPAGAVGAVGAVGAAGAAGAGPVAPGASGSPGTAPASASRDPRGPGPGQEGAQPTRDRGTARSPHATTTPGTTGGTGPSGGAGAPGTPGRSEPARHAGPSPRPERPVRQPESEGRGSAGPARSVDGGHPDDPAPGHQGTPSPQHTGPTDPAPPAGAGPHALSDTLSDRARSLLVPVADAQQPHPAPAAAGPVLPGRPDADRPAVRAPGEQPGLVGGPPCRWCATPNRPDRHYCVRCAMPLAETGGAAAPARAPWWRRLFGGRRRETPWVGDRPRLRRVFDRIGTWTTLAVVVTVAVLGFLYLPDGVRVALDHFAKRAPVAPDRITASRSYPGHQPELAFDKRSNTWWGPGVSESGKGEWIEVGFSEPTRLLDVIITPGVSARADKIGESALPHRVTATITGKDGKVTTSRLTLDQGPGGQRRPFRVGEVTKVRLTVDSSHAASADKQVAIAEIEFFGPSNAGRS
ncbi:zinc ribbon domain-containing protein [Streptomyces sp. NPDC093801]|uniref:NADase-type glycan-binding domain-containing protein n=1 Tax=Streptomyces sp. NPDC093801 TaxID=3155203 RepID=UPI00344D683E